MEITFTLSDADYKKLVALRDAMFPTMPVDIIASESLITFVRKMCGEKLETPPIKEALVRHGRVADLALVSNDYSDSAYTTMASLIRDMPKYS